MGGREGGGNDGCKLSTNRRNMGKFKCFWSSWSSSQWAGSNLLDRTFRGLYFWIINFGFWVYIKTSRIFLVFFQTVFFEPASTKLCEFLLPLVNVSSLLEMQSKTFFPSSRPPALLESTHWLNCVEDIPNIGKFKFKIFQNEIFSL